MVSTPSRFAVSSAANRVAADIERTVQRHTAAACKRNQFGHTFLIKIALGVSTPMTMPSVPSAAKRFT